MMISMYTLFTLLFFFYSWLFIVLISLDFSFFVCFAKFDKDLTFFPLRVRTVWCIVNKHRYFFDSVLAA